MGVPLAVQYIKDEMCSGLLDKIKKKVTGLECNLLTLARKN